MAYIRRGDNKRESWWIKNLTNKTITIGDLLLIPAIKPGKRVDALHYYPREKVGHSTVLTSLVKAGIVSFNKDKIYTNEFPGSISSSNIDEAITPGEENEIFQAILTLEHNDLQEIQGGALDDYYHLTGLQYNTLTDGSNADSLHIHSHNFLSGIQGGTTGEYYHLIEDKYNLVNRLDEDSSGLTFDGISLLDSLWTKTGTTLSPINNENILTTGSLGAGDITGTSFVSGGNITSDTDNTDALGTDAISWSDLFLGNGSVINWSTAPSTLDITLTHSANTLTFSGVVYFDFGNSILTTSGNININSNSSRLYFGENQNASVYYDGTDLNIDLDNPSIGGVIKLNDDVDVLGRLSVDTVNYNNSNNLLVIDNSSNLIGYKSDPISATNEPTGFVSRTDSTLSFTAGRVFTITPTSGNYVIWQKGIKYTISEAKEITLDDTSGYSYIYFDEGELSFILDPSHVQLDYAIENYVLVGLVYWNANVGTSPIFADERHGTIMSGSTHHYLHDTIGTKFESGFTLNDYILDTASDAALTFTVVDGRFYDEDIEINISDDGTGTDPYTQILNTSNALIPVMYRDDIDGSWVEDSSSNLPYKNSGDNTNLNYNLDDGDGTFSQVPLDNNKFMTYTLIATNDRVNPIKMVQGQTVYGSRTEADLGAEAEIVAFGSFPSTEIILLYRFVMQSGNYTGVKNAKIIEVIDFRTSTLLGTGAVATSHGSLSGLSNDDHSQYALLAGRSGGQTLIGGTLATQTLILKNNTIDNTGITIGASVVGLGALDLTTTGLGTFGNIDVDTLNFNGNVITDSTETISFDNNNLITSGNINIDSNSSRLYLGDNQNSSIYFDGTDLNIDLDNPSIGGVIKLNDDVEILGDITCQTLNYTTLNPAIDFSGYVPYAGATTTVNLGSQDLTTTGAVQAEQLTSTDDITMAGLLTNTTGTTDANAIDLNQTYTGTSTTGTVDISSIINTTASVDGVSANTITNTLTNNHKLTGVSSFDLTQSNNGISNTITATGVHDGEAGLFFNFIENNTGITNSVSVGGRTITAKKGIIGLYNQINASGMANYINCVFMGYDQPGETLDVNLIGVTNNVVATLNTAAVGSTLNIVGIGEDITVSVNSESLNTTTAYGIYIRSLTGNTLWAYYNNSVGDNFLSKDNVKNYLGTSSDVSIYFDIEDLIINSENETANDEVHFTNFDKYTFDNTLEVTGDITTSGDISIDSNSSKLYFGDNQKTSIYFDGIDLNIDLDNPSTGGVIKLNDDVEILGDITCQTLNYTTLNPAIDFSGYVPYTGATTTVNLGSQDLTTSGNINIDSNSSRLYLGENQDVSIYFDGTDLNIGFSDPSARDLTQQVRINDDLTVDGILTIGSSSIQIDGDNSIITSTSGTISFDNENITTTGLLTLGSGTVLVAGSRSENTLLDFIVNNNSGENAFRMQFREAGTTLSPEAGIYIKYDSSLDLIEFGGIDSGGSDQTGFTIARNTGSVSITNISTQLMNPGNVDSVINFGASGTYGHSLHYLGTGSGDANYLEIRSGGGSGVEFKQFRFHVQSYQIDIPNDNHKLVFGASQDASIYFNAEDLIINSENQTANDEVHFTNFDKYTFDNTVEVTGNTQISGNLGVGTETASTRFHLSGTTSDHYAQIDTGINFTQVAAPIALTATLSGDAGSVDTGDHRYFVTYVTSLGETTVGTASNTITADGSHAVDLTNIPTSSDYRVSARKIYRTIVGSASTSLYHCKLLTTLSDNTTTTYQDTTADSGLTGGSDYPGYYYQGNSTNQFLSLDGVRFAYVDTFGTYFGKDAGINVVSPGTQNTLFGKEAGKSITTGTKNTLMGDMAGRGITTTSGNTIVGGGAAYATTGTGNSIFGMYTGSSLRADSYNTMIGYYVGYNNPGNFNTFVGANSGQYNTGESSVFLGYAAGRYSTASNLLIIDNQNRTSSILEESNSMIYGTFAAAPENQELRFNARVGILTEPDATDVLNVNGSTSITGLLTTSSGKIEQTNRLTSNTTLDDTYHIVFCDTDGGAFEVFLPAGVEGTNYKIIHCSSSGNNLTITPNGTEQIYGSGAGTSIVLIDGEITNIHYNETEGWW